ncbi:MAG: alginate lyase family protein, partial [Alphaproteobacteria bacterium]|nr:alginate lyase family protein [Alphaproteobacteria bacterium]
FNILGSGPVDVRRGRKGGGHRIDWQLDPTTGIRFPKLFSHYRWPSCNFQSNGADIKGPWELARCQHFAALGQAYWLSGNERFAQIYAKTILDFLHHNPPGTGIHWACSMDVALRSVGWMVGLSFFQGSPALSFRWWRRFLKALVAHGRFLAANLEIGNIDKRLITSNHYTANLLGLYWISTCFPHLDAGNVWRGLAERGLEREIRHQILTDGGNFESSVPYHRLTTEMFLSAYAMSHHSGTPLSEGYRDRLLAALRFSKALRQPGGRWPQIGDADNGRGHILTGYGSWSQDSMDHLLVAGAHALNCPDLAEGLPEPTFVEQLFWGDQRPQPASLPPISNPVVFPDFGVAVLHGGESCVSVSNGAAGTQGFGNHKHNDQLAIEWVLGDQPIFIDGGSYTYTRNPDARNHFRSTAQHNTVIVDEEEQNTFDPEALFRMNQEGECSLESSVSSEECVGVSGFHTAYARLDPPVRHQRRILVRDDGIVVISDHLDGGTGHRLCWHMLAHPDVQVTIIDNQPILKREGTSAKLISSRIFNWRVEKGWYSAGYGQRVPTQALMADGAPDEERFILVFVPEGLETPNIDEMADLADTVFGNTQSRPK